LYGKRLHEARGVFGGACYRAERQSGLGALME